MREARLPRRQQQWRVWQPWIEIPAFVALIIFAFYITGERQTRLGQPVAWRTYTVCDLAHEHLAPGAKVRVFGALAGDSFREASLHHDTCAYYWLAFHLSDRARSSRQGAALASAMEQLREPPLVPGAPGAWKGSFYVIVEGRVTTGEGWGEIGTIEVEQVRTWRYRGDGVGLDWWRPSPEDDPDTLTWNKARQFWERCRMTSAKRSSCS